MCTYTTPNGKGQGFEPLVDFFSQFWDLKNKNTDDSYTMLKNNVQTKYSSTVF
jgi:hypothetical protein